MKYFLKINLNKNILSKYFNILPYLLYVYLNFKF